MLFPRALRLVALLVAGSASTSIAAQNLVLNPSFENFSQCPITIGQTAYCDDWISPTNGTPDFHHGCNTTGIVDVPTNVWGTENARTGQGYVSCIVYMDQTSYVGEYVEAPLSAPLSAGVTYQVSYWVSLADKSRFAIAEMGAYLSVGSVAVSSSVFPLPYTPQIENTGTILTGKTGWTQVTGTLVANGGEDHIVIGCFRAGTATTNQDVGGLNQWANYYIDDVSVVGPSTQGIPAQLVGWSDITSPLQAGFVDVQDVEGNCQPAVTRCRTPLLQAASARYAGGTAYDARHQTVWVSEGTQLAEYYLDPARSCLARCRPQRAVIQNSTAHVSGLAHGERRAQLFQLATAAGYAEIATYDTRACPRWMSACRIVLNPRAFATGLAYDEVSDRLFLSISEAQSTGGFSTELWITSAADPCRVICRTKLFDCTQELSTGLAYDSCARRLYATDGQVTQIFEEDPLTRCTWRPLGCCPKQISPVYRGLALVPADTKRTFGRPCTTRPCADCPQMRVVCAGDPSLGSTFQFGLANGPSGASAWLVGKVGSCGPAVSLPRPLCGSLYATPIQFVFPAIPVNGTTACNGTASLGLPVPPDRALCGMTLCLQWYLTCRSAAGQGMGLTPAVQFSITGG